jgi:phospholipase/carboxylesterase
VTERLDAVEVEPGRAPRAAVIWMHGLGADGHDFEPIVPELQLPDQLAVRFVFPHAPMRPVTINNGWVMRAWYDVRNDRGQRREDSEGVQASQQQIEALIAREKARGIPASAIVLAGFSQGGAMALHTGLRHPEPLGGMVALSCFLPLADTLGREASAAGRAVSIFMAHGVDDPLIPLARGQRARDLLVELGSRVEWHEYRMPHSVCAEEVRDLSAWLSGVLRRT